MLIRFDAETLFNRCLVAVLNSGELSEQSTEMCEHDRAWFGIALQEAKCIVLNEIDRIAKNTENPLIDSCCYDDFLIEVEPTTLLQQRLLPNAIEQYIISHVVNLWFHERLGVQAYDISNELAKLKHVTLINRGISRKPYQ